MESLFCICPSVCVSAGVSNEDGESAAATRRVGEKRISAERVAAKIRQVPKGLKIPYVTQFKFETYKFLNNA